MGLRYNHISNGGIKKPNKGMNFPMVTIGLNRYLSQPNYKKLISGDSILNYRFNKKIDMQFLLAILLKIHLKMINLKLALK
jgi:hypothetical protein